MTPNLSIERTSSGRLRLPTAAAHVERYASKKARPRTRAMFQVLFTDEARASVHATAQREGFAEPGVMVLRQGPAADVSRGQNGEPSWAIQHRHPWRAEVGDFASFDTDIDVHLIDGIRVWLALVPKPYELGVTVSLRKGELHVESLDA